MTIQERKDELYHDCGINLDNMSVDEIRDIIDKLDILADDIEDQEAHANTVRNELKRILNEFAYKYKGMFKEIYLFGGDITSVEDDDIDFNED